jgi:hypothetical protein
MEVGFIFDHAFGKSYAQLGWGKGQPSRSLGGGVASVSGLDPYPITSYRCKKCGLLESYVAQDTVE